MPYLRRITGAIRTSGIGPFTGPAHVTFAALEALEGGLSLSLYTEMVRFSAPNLRTIGTPATAHTINFVSLGDGTMERLTTISMPALTRIYGNVAATGHVHTIDVRTLAHIDNLPYSTIAHLNDANVVDGDRAFQGIGCRTSSQYLCN